jgi:hypothetical protein
MAVINSTSPYVEYANFFIPRPSQIYPNLPKFAFGSGSPARNDYSSEALDQRPGPEKPTVANKPGMPDLHTKNINLVYISEGLVMEKFGFILWPFLSFYGHLVCFVAMWHILWSFGITCIIHVLVPI